ncbi:MULTISPECIES: GDSL-type esterase/lipase family protein [Streptomyces]|uniref:GDSL-type esterase/lipase family protein n=1 Tax=Streptomyces glycanivorans TaxID=3033808 RepID=A0ABY9JQ06_9ACTN|nr:MULTISPECIES: GDSL-type esterase/lipase family protein [unclassified Streptomyces]WLQ68639.1 GDSL-type esterase/lipase family protein [Streptomyces sp. Alt3]WSR52715.1 GDSL-type esterase/lipase family protein [Streptomyces sp. NBC_01201]
MTAAVAALAAPAPTSVGSQPKPGQKLAQESAHGATVAPALARDLVNAQVAGPISPGSSPVAETPGVPAAFASWDQLRRVQGKMNETAGALEHSAGQSEGSAFAGVIAAPEDKRVIVYWHGALTPAAQAAIARSATPVVVRSAKYSVKVLSAASARVAQRAQSADVQLAKVIRPQDGSGLQASVVGGEAEAARLRQAVASVGVPVKVTPGGEVQTSLADPSRNTDPTAGGAQMISPVCSTAFAAKYQGREVMLTADHCFSPGSGIERYVVDSTGGRAPQPFGTRVSPKVEGPVVDVAALQPWNGTQFEPRIWTGSAADAGSSGQKKTWVNGAMLPQKGNWICNDGSRSGMICNIQITDRSEDYFAKGPDGNGKEVMHHYRWGWDAKKRVTSKDSSPVAGRRGDSGGPVILSTGRDDTGTEPNAFAMGIVSASAGAGFTCPTGVQTICFKAITFVGIDDALNYLGDSSLTAVDFPNTTARRDLNFQGQAPTPAPAPTPEVHEHTELVAANGTALGYDSRLGKLTGEIPGDREADWAVQQATDGGWYFQNLASPLQNFGISAATGMQIVSVGGDEVQIQIQQGVCLHLETDIAQAETASTALPAPCNINEIDQRFTLVPVTNDLADPTELPPPSQGRMNLPSSEHTTPVPRLSVMPLGDSITLGVGSDTRTGYRPGLANRLAGAADTVKFVGSQTDADGTRHEGHSGWRIDQLQANIETWLAEAKPNVITLHIGTNDMNRNYQVSTAPQRLGVLLDQINAASPDTAIVVASLVPATDPAVQARVNAYNKAIPDVIAARTSKGFRITQVSMGALTTADLNDNLHPNNAGYVKMADAFQDGIATLARNGWIKETVEVKPAPPKRAANVGDYNVDINGDGLADYLVVDDNGATRAWLNTGPGKWSDQGVIATGSGTWTDNQVRFADVGGDARADYLVVEPNGATRAFINQGGDGRGGWLDKGYIATGSPNWTGDQVRFADVAGDAHADYLVVDAHGATRAWLTTTDATTGTIKLTDQGIIASGSAAWTSDQARFADVGGDARADYLVVEPNGATRAFINQGGNGRGGWLDKGYIATGSPNWTGSQVRFANTDGDAHADYLVLDTDGSIHAWLTTTDATTGTIKLTDQGIIATGTGAPSDRVRI